MLFQQVCVKYDRFSNFLSSLQSEDKTKHERRRLQLEHSALFAARSSPRCRVRPKSAGRLETIISLLSLTNILCQQCQFFKVPAMSCLS